MPLSLYNSKVQEAAHLRMLELEGLSLVIV